MDSTCRHSSAVEERNIEEVKIPVDNYGEMKKMCF